MQVQANGETHQLHESATLDDLIESLGLGSRWVVAEVNGEAVERSAMSTLELSDGDRIELVRAVAGG